MMIPENNNRAWFVMNKPRYDILRAEFLELVTGLIGGITKAVERIRRHCDLAVEVEASNLDQIKECVSLNVQRILLDNMNNDLLKESLKLIPAHIQTEASGNMTLSRIKDVVKLNVDYISVGQITHSAPVADLSLLFEIPKA